VLNLVHVSAFSAFSGRYSTNKITTMASCHTCTIIELNTDIKIVKKVKKHRTYIAEIHFRVQGYAPVSPVAVYITMDECSVQYCWV
jgi:hypothetical protein